MLGGLGVKGWESLCARPLSSQVLQVLPDPSGVLPVPSQYPPLPTPKCRVWDRPAVALAFALGEAGSGNARGSEAPGTVAGSGAPLGAPPPSTL